MAALLVVTAVPAERDAILAAFPEPATPSPTGPHDVARSHGVDVLVGGVGPAEAAAATSAALAAQRYDLVVCAGIGGGFGAVPIGGIAVATRITFAGLGAETAGGFTPLSGLGFGREHYDVDPDLAARLAAATGGLAGSILTVATVTGTAESATRLLRAHPDAVAEGMEGAGVAAAAVRHGVPFAELRAISNRVGPRQRDAWRIPDALHALAGAVVALVASPWRIEP